MFTINEYIDSLKNDKNTLVANLTSKGISGLTGNETFTELVPKVLDIIGVNNQSKSVTINTNTETVIEPDTGYTGLSSVTVTTNVSADIGEYFKTANVSGNGNGYNTFIKKVPTFTSIGTDLQYLFYGLNALEELPIMDTSNVTNMTNMCFYCQTITTLPQYNTSSVTNFDRFCYGCSALANVPVLNLTSATGMNQMFQNCPSLTDTSLDNILQMCINATSYAGLKTLKTLLGQNTSAYPASRIQALPHYQDFIDAGWTIGY